MTKDIHVDTRFASVKSNTVNCFQLLLVKIQM